jgi:hypothetical protein
MTSSQTGNFTATATANTTINPIADAYVQDGTSASTNYGTAAVLVVRTDSKANNGLNRDSYFKFNLNGISGNISSAKLLMKRFYERECQEETPPYLVMFLNY